MVTSLLLHPEEGFLVGELEGRRGGRGGWRELSYNSSILSYLKRTAISVLSDHTVRALNGTCCQLAFPVSLPLKQTGQLPQAGVITPSNHSWQAI